MTPTTQWLIDQMEAWAPAAWAIETDNVGLQIGDLTRPVHRVLCALDLSEEVLREAIRGRFDFIITHHPLISRHVQPINRITADNALGKKLMSLIGNGIGLFCAHTNLDVAPGGVNDLLFELIGLSGKESLSPSKIPELPTLGLVGHLPRPLPLAEIAAQMKEVLSSDVIRFIGQADRMISKVGLCSGNGTHPDLVRAALRKNCELYITGDVGYHLAMEAVESGMALIDGTHYATEIPIAAAIANQIKNSAEIHKMELHVECAQTNGQVFKPS